MSETMSETPAPEAPRGIGATLRNKSNRKMLLLIGVPVVLLVTYGLLHHSHPVAVSQSKLGSVPTLQNQTTGTVSPDYVVSLRRNDSERLAQAKASGGDALPTIVDGGKAGSLPTTLSGDTEKPADPIIRPQVPVQPVIQAPLNRAPLAPTVLPPYQQQQQLAQERQRAQADDKAAQHLQEQLSRYLVNDFAPKSYEVAAEQHDAVGGTGGGEPRMASADAAAAPSPGFSPTAVQNVAATDGPQFQMPTPGTVLYAKLVTEVNSDAPGPVIAEILQGPFTGARMLGTFTTATDANVISFTGMTVPYTDDGGDPQTKFVPVKAFAVDSSTLGTGLATDVNRHLITKIGFQLATGFLQGFGQAVASSGSTALLSPLGGSYVSNTIHSTPQELWEAGGTAAGQVGQTLQQEFGNQKTTVKVAAGTPIGLLFMPAQ